MRRAGIGLVVVLGVVGTNGVVRADWTRWRGTSGDSRATQAGFEAQAVAGRLRVAWRAEVGRGHSAVVARGDRVYTVGMRALPEGNRASEEIVYCLSASTGKEIWRYAYKTRSRSWPGPAATPLLDGQVLFVVGREGEVLALDATAGTVVWKRHLAEEKLARPGQWGFCSSPVVDGDLLLLNAPRAGIAFDKRTGRTVWTSEPDNPSSATPVVFSRQGKRLAAVRGGGNVTIVDVRTGKAQWSEKWESDTDPTVIGNRMLLAGGGRATGSRLLEMGPTAARTLWTGAHLGNTFISPVVIDGYAYGFGRDRRQVLQCIDLATGALQWSQDLGEWGSLIAVNKTLVIGEGDGDLVFAEASPKGFRETARVRAIPMTAAQTGAQDDEMRGVWTTPSFDAGRIYLRDNFGAVVCVMPRS